MVKNKTKTKSGLNVFVFNEEELLEHDGNGDAQEENSRFDGFSPESTYDPHTEKMISNQASSALLYLLFYSILMFTLPFGAFYGTRHWLQEHTDFSVFAISSLSASASVITVYIIIALYAYHAYHEKDVVIPGEGSIDDSTTTKVKTNQNKQKQKKN